MTDDANKVLARAFDEYRSMAPERLAKYVDHQMYWEVLAEDSGVKYGILLEIFWDSRRREDIRIVGDVSAFTFESGWTRSLVSGDIVVSGREL